MKFHAPLSMEKVLKSQGPECLPLGHLNLVVLGETYDVGTPQNCLGNLTYILLSGSRVSKEFGAPAKRGY